MLHFLTLLVILLSTTAGVALAGVDMNVTNSAGSTTWDLATTVSGIDLTLASTQKVTAAFGLAGNTMTVSSIPAVAEATASAGTTTWYRYWWIW